MDDAKNHRKVVIWNKEALETNLAIYGWVEDGFWKIYYSSSYFSSFGRFEEKMGEEMELLALLLW